MDYRAATDRIAALNITHETIAQAQATALNMVARARMDPTSADYRKPPPDWRAVLARLARERAAALIELADELEANSGRH